MHEQRSSEEPEERARLDGATPRASRSLPIPGPEAAQGGRLASHLEVSVFFPPPSVFWRTSGAELGAIIRARRKLLRLNIELLAEQAGMHPTYLSSIERGRRNPTWDKVSDIAEALGVPVSTLAREAEVRRISGALHEAALSAYCAAWGSERIGSFENAHHEHRG